MGKERKGIEEGKKEYRGRKGRVYRKERKSIEEERKSIEEGKEEYRGRKRRV